MQVVAEAKAVFGANGKQMASRQGADAMAYTLSGVWVGVYVGRPVGQ